MIGALALIGQSLWDELEVTWHVWLQLPRDIADRHVMLLDPILATGNSAMRAIQARFLFPSSQP